MVDTLVLVCLLSLGSLVFGLSLDTQACVKEDPCTCKFSDGKVLSLRSLAKSDGTAAFKVFDSQSSYDFYFNPCLTFTEGSCGGGDVAVCQDLVPHKDFSSFACGLQSSAEFVHRDSSRSDVYLRFQGGTDARSSYIKLICSNTTESALTFVSENPVKVYNLELRSPCACPGTTDTCNHLPKVTCDQKDECSCRMSDGSGDINLRALNSPQAPLLYNSSSVEQFYYNPCVGFTMDRKNASVNQCKDVSVCESLDAGRGDEMYLDLGKPASASFDVSGSKSVSLNYVGSDGRRSGVELICDRGAREKPVFELVKQSGNNFTFSLRSVCACPGGCVSPPRHCQEIDECSCKYQDGSGTVSLRFLDNPYSPLVTSAVQDPTITYTYYYNPCSGLKIGTGCFDVSACQQVNNTSGGTSQKFSLGTVKNATFVSDENGRLSINYSGGDGGRTYRVFLECDPEARVPVFGNSTENPLTHYTFNLRTKCACPNACPIDSTLISRSFS